MIEFKPGNGGHGPEAYDTETGQYVEVECSLEGQAFKGWEELRDLILDMDPDTKQQYEQDAENREAIDNYIKNELYGPLLQEAINNKNKESSLIFETVDDAINNAHKLFTKDFFDMYYENTDNEGRVLVNKENGYVVNGFACFLQRTRYPKKVMNKISKAEYDSLMEGVSGFVSSGDSFSARRAYIRKNPDGFPVWRGMGISSVYNVKDVIKSFYDENSPYISTLSHAGAKNCSYYGAVTYMSMDENYAEMYNGRALIKGFVKNPDKLRVLESPTNWGSTTVCNDDIKEVNEFRAKKNVFLNNVKNQLMGYGRMQPWEKSEFMRRLSRDIDENPGLCGMLMGYDAIMGADAQFDILNPGIVYVEGD